MKKIIVLILTVITLLLALASCSLGPTTVNGVEISEYKIVYSESDSDYSRRAAEFIKDEIKARTGAELEIVTDKSESSECEIVVGETSREISKSLDADCDGDEFALFSEGTTVALEGDYFLIAAAAYYFVDTYVPSKSYSATVPSEVSICRPIVKEAKNFIMLIGDGMGVNHTRLFEKMNNEEEFGDGEDIFYGYYLSGLGYSRTDSLSGTTDSAAGGTALSSGYKTNNDFVGVDKDGNDVLLLTELAASLGKSTAVMSTEKQQGATPASFSAHESSRENSSAIYLDQHEMKNSLGTIIDCGYDHYDSKGVADIEETVREILDKLDDDKDGFFLMYEEAHIDKHGHRNDLEETFSAMVRFNQIIATFMEYAFYNPDTFVLITADHETGGITEADGKFSYTTDEHTSADVPVFTHGASYELFDGVTFENVQIPMTIAHFMGKSDFGDAENFSRLTK